jgi:glycosyltransferase involved in cell wall biosynthesis
LRNKTKEETRQELHLPKDKKIVLFLHRLSRRKGVHLLPEIIQKLENRDDVLFLIVGDGPEKSYLVSRISYLRLEDTVRMVGVVPNYKIPQYMVAADIYLMPSEEEGMPNALLEAMAAGVPFVASDVAAVREMTSPTMHEFVLPYGNTKAFAEKIKKLLVDEELRGKIFFEEREWVKQYDVSIIAPRFLKLFQEARKVP